LTQFVEEDRSCGIKHSEQDLGTNDGLGISYSDHDSGPVNTGMSPPNHGLARKDVSGIPLTEQALRPFPALSAALTNPFEFTTAATLEKPGRLDRHGSGQGSTQRQGVDSTSSIWDIIDVQPDPMTSVSTVDGQVDSLIVSFGTSNKRADDSHCSAEVLPMERESNSTGPPAQSSLERFPSRAPFNLFSHMESPFATSAELAPPAQQVISSRESQTLQLTPSTGLTARICADKRSIEEPKYRDVMEALRLAKDAQAFGFQKHKREFWQVGTSTRCSLDGKAQDPVEDEKGIARMQLASAEAKVQATTEMSVVDDLRKAHEELRRARLMFQTTLFAEVEPELKPSQAVELECSRRPHFSGA
jgi:hypothetical protein